MLKRKIKPPSTRWVDLEPRSKVKTALHGKRLSPVGKNTRGQQHRDWLRELYADFTKLGIMTCEVQTPKCMGTFGAALAHSRKRRYISSKKEFWEVVLACVKCHEWLDNVLSHEEMEAKVKEIIAKRNI